MNRLFLLLAAVVLGVTPGVAQQDDTGSGRALSFDGVDDYVSLGNIFDDLALPMTISAWVKIGSEVRFSPIFTAQDGADLYNGFQFVVSPTTLSIEYGDGRGENSGAYLRGKRATNLPSLADRWIHICGIMRGPADMSLYVNGQDVGGVHVGSSPYTMNSNFPSDVAKIGYWHSNGLTYNFKGLLDELRVWNRALSINEIRTDMCRRLTGNENGLIGYWTFDETSGTTLTDKSANHFNGTILNGPQRVFSGAPLGDESTFIYPASWSGVTLSMDNYQHDVEVYSVTGSPWGAHLYKVHNIPSQTSGLPAGTPSPYFGIFMAGNDQTDQFTVKVGNCTPSFSRQDNGVSSWNTQTLPANVMHRTELVLENDLADLNLDLGNDLILCDQTSYQISTNLDPSDFDFSWNTGQSTPGITVNASGVYSVEVSGPCQKQTDEISILFSSPPPSFSLGDDLQLCTFQEYRLQSPITENFNLEWSDGSSKLYLDIKGFGKYWLSVKNHCGESNDTLSITQETLKFGFVPNVISSNGDGFNQYFELNRTDGSISPFSFRVFNRWGRKVYESNAYHNEWDGSDLSSGVYYYVVNDVCGNELKGSVSVIK